MQQNLGHVELLSNGLNLGRIVVTSANGLNFGRVSVTAAPASTAAGAAAALTAAVKTIS